MRGLEKNRVDALVTLLNAQIQNKTAVVLDAKELNDGSYYAGTSENKIRIFGGDDTDLYKLHIGGTLEQPSVVIKGHTYDGIAKLFDSIEAIQN